ncbi:hypothetical protein J4446_02665 [Candidatus Woesearchaeota archaeon]|nr:hypothetical protein [Candidatus Woesearchaeota archaeon]
MNKISKTLLGIYVALTLTNFIGNLRDYNRGVEQLSNPLYSPRLYKEWIDYTKKKKEQFSSPINWIPFSGPYISLTDEIPLEIRLSIEFNKPTNIKIGIPEEEAINKSN